MPKLHLVAIMALLLFCGVYVTLAQNDTWIELSSLFGVARPFRQGHSASMTVFGRMVSFSGLDNTLTGSLQVTRFNYLTTSQLQILDNNPFTDKPSRQLCGFGTYNDSRLVVYGGLVGGVASKELLVYDIPGGIWVENITTSLNDPTHNIENHFAFSAESPAAAIDQEGGELWLFGGKSTILQLNFITRVDLVSYEFTQVNLSDTTNQPARRHGSTMAFYNNGLWMFGGRDALGDDPTYHTYFNDVKRYSGGSWSTGPSGGPSARAYMASTLRKDGTTWILFGGSNSKLDQVYNDVWAFDLSGGSWDSLSPSGTPPTGRDKLVAVPLQWNDEDSILFYGGADDSGGSLNNFWKLQFVAGVQGPVDPPPNLDVDADVTDEITATSVPPPSSSSVSSSSSSVGSLLPEDDAASALASWCSLLWA